MRTVFKSQLSLNQIPIQEIELDPKSRDDIIKYLYGLQCIYLNAQTQEKLFSLLRRSYVPEKRKDRGRPGMDLWRILVLAGLKQVLNCDYDRLEVLANGLKVLRQMLGHGDEDRFRYNRQTIQDNVSALSPELLDQVNQLIVELGHNVVGHEEGATLKGRCDSKVVKTNVHYPTDVNLLWDALRCLLGTCAKQPRAFELPGWRQSKHNTAKVKKHFDRVRSARQYKRNRKGVKAYLRICLKHVERAETLLEELDALEQALLCASGPRAKQDRARLGAIQKGKAQIRWFLECAYKLMDQVERRILKGETIPHHEKIFSIFKPHTRWIKKGKAGVPQELGVPAAIVEDQYQFLLGHSILWTGTDKDIAVPLIESTQQRYSELRDCSFDRGFYSPSVRDDLDTCLEMNAMLKKGRCTKKEKKRQSTPEFKKARQAHSAVESALNNLDHRGWSLVREVSEKGFERVVATAVIAANIHRLGTLVGNRAHERPRRAT